jgi:hypothetical protein
MGQGKGATGGRLFFVAVIKMLVVNTCPKKRCYVFSARCASCPGSSFVAVAWDVPEPTFPETMAIRGSQCPCIVCLSAMVPTAFILLGTKAQEAVVRSLGHEPEAGRIEIVPFGQGVP